MPIQDNLLFWSSAQVINGSGTSQYSNIYDTQGDNQSSTLGYSTATGSYGWGGGKPVFFAAVNVAQFTTVTSVNLQVQTSDTYNTSTFVLSGTVNTLFSSGVIAIASLTGGILWPAAAAGTTQPTIIPLTGCLRYLQILYTVVGPSTSETGSVTAYVAEDIDALQFIKYPISAIA